MRFFRSSHLRCSVRPSGLQFYLKRDSGTCVSCEVCEILRTAFYMEHLRWLLLIFQISTNICCTNFGNVLTAFNVLNVLTITAIYHDFGFKPATKVELFSDHFTKFLGMKIFIGLDGYFWDSKGCSKE